MNTSETLTHTRPPNDVVVSLWYTVITVVGLGIAYPILVWLLGEAFFRTQTEGSLVTDHGTVIGSSLVGQSFTSMRYFHGRPSAAGKGYDPTSTGGTNFSEGNKQLLASTQATIRSIRHENPSETLMPPIDLITSSASGIDPDISPQAALYQAARIAEARHISVLTVRNLVLEHITERPFGILGERRVNVLNLNRLLDQLG